MAEKDPTKLTKPAGVDARKAEALELMNRGLMVDERINILQQLVAELVANSDIELVADQWDRVAMPNGTYPRKRDVDASMLLVDSRGEAPMERIDDIDDLKKVVTITKDQIKEATPT